MYQRGSGLTQLTTHNKQPQKRNMGRYILISLNASLYFFYNELS